jgi:hypothetical protein
MGMNMIGDRLLQHPTADWALAVTLTGAHVAVVEWHGRFDALGNLDVARRIDLYGDALTVTGVLLGFTGAALAGYLALNNSGITAVRRRAGGDLTRQWVAAITGPAVALLLFFTAKIFDRAEVGSAFAQASSVRWLAELGAILVVLRMSRLLFVYAQLVGIASQDDSNKEPARPVRILGPKKAS